MCRRGYTVFNTACNLRKVPNGLDPEYYHPAEAEPVPTNHDRELEVPFEADSSLNSPMAMDSRTCFIQTKQPLTWIHLKGVLGALIFATHLQSLAKSWTIY